MADNSVVYGVSSIKFGDLAGDGGPSTSLNALGLSKEGSISFTEDEPTRTEFKAEEVDDPVFVSLVRGKRTLKLTLLSADADTLKKVFGGDVAAGPPKVWSAPDNLVAVEKTVEITTRNGSVITLNRGLLNARFTGNLSKSDQFGIEITVDVLQPTKAGVKSITWKNAPSS